MSGWQCVVTNKAVATWQWWNFLEAALPEGRELLRLNLDETACKLYHKPRKGDLADKNIAAAHREGSLVQYVDLGQQKAALSHMALVCDVPALQPQMPQFIVGNEHVLSKAVLDSMPCPLPANVHLLRRKSSWVNHTIMAEWSRALSKALAPHRARYQPVLLLDVCPVHCGTQFLTALRKAGIRVVFVPAGLTWLLQVCDTHLFAKYKAFLCARQHSRLLATEGRKQVSTADAVEDIVHGIRRVLQGTEWAPAFDGNGYGKRQRCTRARILRELECTDIPDVPKTLPTLSQIESLFPRGRTPAISLLFNAVCAAHAQPHMLAEPVAAAAPPSPEVEAAHICVSPWAGRLRSSSRHNIGSPLAQDLPPVPPPAAAPPPCPPPPSQTAARVQYSRLPVGRRLTRPRAAARPAVGPDSA